ncbi:hypothetical protein HJFPF1_11843 [Paramyrothecium foliicola]|nr:hypothetical protein HJFPF1_11843 [Paramyrothecium foliicola]
MSGTDEPHPGLAQRQRRGFVPTEITELLYPSFKVGAWTGSAGVLAGVGGSIAKDTNPFIGGTLTGISWFTLGGTYWFTRTVTARAWGGEAQMKPLEKTALSAVSGSAAGAMVGLLRGPSTIIPGMVFWSVAGAGGQLIANQVVSYQARHHPEKESWLASKWSPLKKITDQEYVDMMEEKILVVDADIALIDERIAVLRGGDQMTNNGKITPAQGHR